MSPKRHRTGSPNGALQKQQGFLLPVAMFIIVIMGFASLALWRTTAQSSTASVQELLSTQAFYAAESGLQVGLNALFYPDAGSPTTVDSNCTGLSQSLDFSGVDGLNLCSAEVSCVVTEPGFYLLEAEGECRSGPTRAQRALEVQARF